MKNWLLLLFVTLLLPVLPAGDLAAQGAPEPIRAAYADLSQRVGVTLDTTNTNWRWQQELFDDTSLGCPQPGVDYAQRQVPGYIFTITYAGTTYDYRVSADETIVILCESRAEGEPAAPTDDDDTYSSPLCPLPEDPQDPAAVRYIRSRVALDTQATNITGGDLSLYTQPDDAAPVVATVPPQIVFRIVNGPACDDEGMVWWQVDYDGTSGWVIESQEGIYRIAPMPPNPLPDRLRISPANAIEIVEFGRLQGNITPELAWSPDGARLAVPGAPGAEGVWLYNIDALNEQPRIVERDQRALSLQYAPDASGVWAGTDDGGAYLWDVRPEAELVERLYLNTHERDSRLAIAPGGTLFAAAGVNALTSAAGERAHGILLWDVETVAQQALLDSHTAPVIALRFNHDGTRLASLDADGTLYVHAVPEGTVVASADDATARAIAYSPDGAVLAVGRSDGSVDLLATGDFTLLAALSGHTAAITGLAYHPAGELLASVSADNTLRLWEAASGGLLVTVDLTEEPAAVAFSPDGALVAVAGTDQVIRLYGVRAEAEAVG